MHSLTLKNWQCTKMYKDYDLSIKIKTIHFTSQEILPSQFDNWEGKTSVEVLFFHKIIFLYTLMWNITSSKFWEKSRNRILEHT